jgi:hypothetical protein
MELTCIMCNLHFNFHTHSKYRRYTHGNADKHEIVLFAYYLLLFEYYFNLV